MEFQKEKKLWFKAKNYGWGWQPITWQGWGVLGIFLYLMWREASRMNHVQDPTLYTMIHFFVSIICIVTLLLVVCYATGEKPEWRWGPRKAK